MTHLDLRAKYPKFIFERYSYEIKDGQLCAYFYYSTPCLPAGTAPDLQFVHTVIFDNLSNLSQINPKNLYPFLFNLGLSEMPSYWKATCSPIIEIQAGQLSKNQVNWWTKLIMNGMGEYFYKNQIDFTTENFLQISSENTTSSPPPRLGGGIKEGGKPSVMVPVAGGKDSIVTLELLKNHFSVTPFIVHPASPAAETVCATAGFPKPLSARRIFDPLMLSLDKYTYLNGHVPYSATLAFTFLLACHLENISCIAVSNERSSLEANLTYLGYDINHQYTKTLEFETDFNNYVYQYLTPDISYFSFLRPLYEFQIAKLFAKYPQYFPIFRSCNRGQQTNSWCGTCAKCLSIALTLMPWIGEAEVVKFMGTNPLNNPENAHLLEQMTNPAEIKPFECVTTTEEAQICLSYIQNGPPKKPSPFLSHWLPDPNIPVKFEGILKEAYARA
jgi:UDP-N-acetyl-alpha-D-muramoyl-L-alanyl-L-glutamate epimerase